MYQQSPSGSKTEARTPQARSPPRIRKRGEPSHARREEPAEVLLSDNEEEEDLKKKGHEKIRKMHEDLKKMIESQKEQRVQARTREQDADQLAKQMETTKKRLNQMLMKRNRIILSGTEQHKQVAALDREIRKAQEKMAEMRIRCTELLNETALVENEIESSDLKAKTMNANKPTVSLFSIFNFRILKSFKIKSESSELIREIN